MTVWDVIATEASAESSLWAAALRPGADWEAEQIFSPLGEERHALGLESIYEGYLLHYGRPRLFAPQSADDALLLGDYLYAHGLVRIAVLRDAAAVADLAALISVCAQQRAEGAGGDGAAWAATAALLGREEIGQARDLLRLRGDPSALLDLAIAKAGEAEVEAALAAHRRRVG
jgi:hypothetical protein